MKQLFELLKILPVCLPGIISIHSPSHIKTAKEEPMLGRLIMFAITYQRFVIRLVRAKCGTPASLARSEADGRGFMGLSTG